jgi:hypothetical protein
VEEALGYAKVALIGAGDLAFRMADRLTFAGFEVVLGGRVTAHRLAYAALLDACGSARIRLVSLDALDEVAVVRFLDSEQPDVVVQCASLLSPWLLAKRGDPRAAAFVAAGFAAQLPAQLPIVHCVMRAVRESGCAAPVVNASYPDVTHPILERLGLAPRVGLGNATMIWLRVRAALRDSFLEEPAVRVFAHHAHVFGCMRSEPPAFAHLPTVYVGDACERRDELAYAGPPLAADSGLNTLTAAAAIPLLKALLTDRPARLSAPGPLGLPGGYPIEISRKILALDLPPNVSSDEAVADQTACAQYDGIERIELDGTVVFCESTRKALESIDPRLAEALEPHAALARFELLRDALRL